jgi:hypothetical protein
MLLKLKSLYKKKREQYNQIGFWFGLFILFYITGLFLPEGYDWENYFSVGETHPIWTPWMVTMPFHEMNWPFIVGITLASLVYRTYHYKKTYLPVILAVLSLPTLWVLFMGNVDGFVLLGLISLPWGTPLALMKPQIAGFALLARRKFIIAGAVWIIITFLIWGFWPTRFLMVLTPEWKSEWTQDISLFPWGLIVGIPLLWFSRGDEDLLMAAGSFVTPHLFPYHFIMLVPSFARMNLPWMLITWLISWTPFSSNWIGDVGWHMGNLLGLSFWLGIYFSRETEPVHQSVTQT